MSYPRTMITLTRDQMLKLGPMQSEVQELRDCGEPGKFLLMAWIDTDPVEWEASCFLLTDDSAHAVHAVIQQILSGGAPPTLFFGGAVQ